MLSMNVVHETKVFDETVSYLGQKNYCIDLLDCGEKGEFGARLTALYHDTFYLAEVEFGAAAHVVGPSRAPTFALSVPVRGWIKAPVDDGEVVGDRARAIITSPSTPSAFTGSKDLKCVILAIMPSAVHTHFARMTGEPVVGDIAFRPELDLGGYVGRSLVAAIDLFAGRHGMTGAGQPHRDHAARAAAFEDSVLSTLLLYHPHSHSEMLAPGPSRPASRDVKRAIDFVHANLGEPIRLETLIAVAQVPGRTLNEHFRAFTGLSPLAYVRRERLKEVRRILTSEPETTVTDAAIRCGITHLGRFAQDYARAFGEAPSLTLGLTRSRLSGY